MRVASSLAAVVGSAALANAALQTIEAYGNKFFDEDGKQWFMKGIAYQLRPDDPLIDTEQCTLDAALMKTLGTNAIRIYHVDPDADHSGCMAAFDEAGIYTMIDLDTFDTYILADDPFWNQTQYDRYTAVMDEFAPYNNVLGFFVGNENIAQKNHSQAAPFLKAAARDMKAYRDRMQYRKIPIGYSAADIKELRPMLQNYLTCGNNNSEIIDFFALNSYSWCDPSSYETSDYEKLQEYADQFPVPIFFSETGCIIPGPRVWDDQDAIFSQPMIDDWSGSMVYEWIYEQNEYGIVSYGPEVAQTIVNDEVFDGFTRKGTPTPKLPDFTNLKSKWATITPTGVSRDDYDPDDVSTRACPTSTEGGWWEVDGNVRLPSLGETFRGSFTSSPTAEPTSSGQDDEDDDNPDAAPLGKHVAGMAAGLVAITLLFTIWL